MRVDSSDSPDAWGTFMPYPFIRKLRHFALADAPQPKPYACLWLVGEREEEGNYHIS